MQNTKSTIWQKCTTEQRDNKKNMHKRRRKDQRDLGFANLLRKSLSFAKK